MKPKLSIKRTCYPPCYPPFKSDARFLRWCKQVHASRLYTGPQDYWLDKKLAWADKQARA